MIGLDEFKHNTGVSKNKYIEKWIDERLIPGVRVGPSLEDTLFPNSARRPYYYRSKIKQKTGTDDIREHIVNACLRREHITKDMCFMTQDEFNLQIGELVNCGLVLTRIEDGITYYDSTMKCESVRGKNLKEIRKFIIDLSEALVRGAAEGLVKGSINGSLSGETSTSNT